MLPHGPRDIRVGRSADGNFAIQLRISKSDPIAPYVIAAIEKAAHTIRDPLTGFTEVRDGDDDAAEDLTQVLMNLLPDDLKARFEQESVDAKKRTHENVASALRGMGIGGVLSALGASGPFAKQVVVDNAQGMMKSVLKNLPDTGDEINRMIRPDTSGGRYLMETGRKE